MIPSHPIWRLPTLLSRARIITFPCSTRVAQSKRRIAGLTRNHVRRSLQTSASRLSEAPAPLRYEPAKKYLFPERLLIYHAGTGRTTFLAALKMTTVFVCGFFCFIVTPAYLASPEVPWEKAAGMAACGIIPLAFVAYSTAPIVTYVHIRLPTFVRTSRQSLQLWAKSNINPSTELELSSMTFLARPKQTAVKLGDLQPAQSKLGVANFELIPGAKSTMGSAPRKGGKVWRTMPLKRFNIQGFNREAREGWVWDELAKQIEARAQAKKRAKRKA